MANTPKRVIKKAEPGVTMMHTVITVVVTVFATILIKAYIESDKSPFPSQWADKA